MSELFDELDELREQSLIACLLKKALADEKNDDDSNSDDSDAPTTPDDEYDDSDYDIGHNPDVSYVAIAYNDGNVLKFEGSNAPKAKIGDKEYIESWADRITEDLGGWKALYVKGGTYYIEYGDTDGVYWSKNPGGQVIEGRWTDKYQPLHPKKSLKAYNETLKRYIEKSESKGFIPQSTKKECE